MIINDVGNEVVTVQLLDKKNLNNFTKKIIDTEKRIKDLNTGKS